METTRRGHPWELGASEQGVVAGDYLAGSFRVVAVGPSAGQRSLDPRFAALARDAAKAELRQAVPLEDPTEDLRRLIRRLDRAIRDTLTDGIDGRATLVCCTVRQGRAWMAHTGEGSVYLFRDGTLDCLVQALPDSLASRAQRRRATSRRSILGRHVRGDVPWIGARIEGDERQPIMVRVTEVPIELAPGDRLFLCTAPPAGLESIQALAPIVAGGRPDEAAQALCDVLHLRDGVGDVAVAMVDWHASPTFEDERPAALDASLLADFEGLIADISEELEIDHATPAFAPDRDSWALHHDGELLDSVPTQLPEDPPTAETEVPLRVPPPDDLAEPAPQCEPAGAPLVAANDASPVDGAPSALPEDAPARSVAARSALPLSLLALGGGVAVVAAVLVGIALLLATL